MKYLDDLHILFQSIDSNRFLIEALQEQKLSFDVESEQLFYDVMMISLKYYDGKFSEAYKELNARLPLHEIANLNYSNFIEASTIDCAMDLYAMEGEVLFKAKCSIAMKNKRNFYPAEIFQLGHFDKSLLSKSIISFTGLEVMYSLNLLNQKIIDTYLEEDVYEKSHIKIMQTNYIKAKMGLITRKMIKPLVVVNPYTQGLKQLMFAFIETDHGAKQACFESALKGLAHIKYYYVEALYFYAKYLKENPNKVKFNEIYQLGKDLARKHHYRFLVYKLEQILAEVPSEYDETKYPLNEDEDIQKYVDFLIKRYVS